MFSMVIESRYRCSTERTNVPSDVVKSQIRERLLIEAFNTLCNNISVEEEWYDTPFNIREFKLKLKINTE